MSELITLSTAQTETIHGSFAGAKSYIAMTYGATYAAWMALVGVGGAVDDPKKQTLAAAVRYLNGLGWGDAAATFALREAIVDVDGRPVFALAEYELAVLVSDDPDITGNVDQGSNVRATGAGAARVEFFNPSSASQGNASVLPPIVDRLIGKYLAARSSSSSGGVSSGGSECPAFGSPELARRWPF